MYSIQGLRTVSNSLPSGLKKILKKGGHNYNTIIENWSNLVGKKISEVCYPKSVKTDKELKKIGGYVADSLITKALENLVFVQTATAYIWNLTLGGIDLVLD